MPLSGWNAITERLLPKSSVEAQVFAANNLQVMARGGQHRHPAF